MRPEPSARVSRGRRLAFYALATVVPAAALFAALEVGGRVYIHVKHGVPGKSYGLWRDDPALGARHRENGYNTHTQTNDFGFRNREPVFEPKPPGALRVIAYGGSTTFCYNLADADAWPARLERLLRERDGHRHQVLNGGAILWSLGHAYARARDDLPRLAPGVVIVYAGINEHTNAEMLAADGLPMRALIAAGDYGRFATNLDQNRWVKRHLVSVRFLDYVVKRRFRGLLGGADAAPAATPAPPSPDPAVLENYLHVLGRFLDLSAAHGARPVFVIQADAGGDARNAYLTSYSRAGAELARDRGAQVVDARRVVEGYAGDPQDLFYVTGVHFSALGAARLAELLYAEVFAPSS